MATDYPVFDLAPNWEEPYRETTSYLTSLVTARDGSEERSCLRNPPRMALEFTVGAADADSARLDQYLTAGPSTPFIVPFWHERVRLKAAAEYGARRITADVARRHFVVGSQAVLLGPGRNELVTISWVDDYGINTVSPLELNWPAGTRMAPAYPGWLDSNSPVTRYSHSLAEGHLRFDFDSVPAWDAGDWEQEYRGLRVWTGSINAVDDWNMGYGRSAEIIDNMTGIISVSDPAGRAFPRRTFTKGFQSFDKLADFRAWISARMGRLVPFYTPTYTALPLLHDLEPGMTAINIDAVNLVGQLNSSGREDIAIKPVSGPWVFAHVDKLTRDGHTVTIHLDAPLSVDLKVRQISMLTWFAKMRLDSDDITYTHRDDELSETRLTFREVMQ